MASGAEKTEPADSEQDEEEDVYEVERIIDMRIEEGEVLYRVRWKNYTEEEDTWEPEAHLEDCREVLLNYKKNLAEDKAKRESGMKLPMKSDLFDADSESDNDRERPDDPAVRKKKKKKKKTKKSREEEEEEEEAGKGGEKKKKRKKEKSLLPREDDRPRPAPESDREDEEDERAPTPPPPRRDKPPEVKKRESDDEDAPPFAKKHRRDKARKEGSEETRRRKKARKEQRSEAESSEEDLSEAPSESQADEVKGRRAKAKQKKGRPDLKLQGIKDFLQEKRSRKPEGGAPAKPKGQGRDEALLPSSDSSDASQRKGKAKGSEVGVPPKAPPSSAPPSSSSSALAGSSKVREEELKEEGGDREPSGSTNLFEKFLLNCEAKDRVPRRQALHPAEAKVEHSKSTAAKGAPKPEKKSKPSKESPARKPELDRTEKNKPQEAPQPGQSPIGQEGRDRAEPEPEARERTDEPPNRSKVGEEARREKLAEEAARGEKRAPPSPESTEEPAKLKERKRKRPEEGEPRLFVACDDAQEAPDSLDVPEKAPNKAQPSLNLGVDLKLDWMTLEDFQKHLNGEDEILSAAVISPGELRDAVKSGDYLAVKLALNSKEDYNLDQEDSSGMSLTMLASAGGQDDILRLLIKKGAKVNGRQKNGTTALMHAAEKNFLTTVAILLEAGACVNAQTLGGETALMKACKRGNAEVVRLLLEYGADCNILSKHKNTAMHFAKLSSNSLLVYDLIKDHVNTLSSVAEETIRAYFETRLALLEPVFPLACHRLCEGPDFSMEFSYKPPPHSPVEGSGVLLFIFHANFLSEITARLCGPCSVHAVVLNDNFQLPIFLDSHFIYSFSPVPGINKLFIRLAEAPTAKVKLLICAYRVQLQ